MNFKRDKGRDIAVPTKGHAADAGYDLYAPHGFVVEPNGFSDRIDLGVGFEIPEGHCGYVVERSSQGKRGISVIGPVVDHGYTGNVHVTLVNNKDFAEVVSRGEKICQLIVLKVAMEGLEEVEAFADTERGANSHGSTGV